MDEMKALFVMPRSGVYLGIPTTLLVGNYTRNPNFLADNQEEFL